VDPRHGLPRAPAELAQRPLIHEESRQQWSDWLRAAGVTEHRALSGPRLSDANLGLDAALAGVGVALATRLTAKDEIAAGRLVELFDTRIRLGRYFFLCAPQLRKDAVIMRSHDWLTQHVHATEQGQD
jgi:LysR family transcriptional regulator, glycine cleavage system transcriptional activator